MYGYTAHYKITITFWRFQCSLSLLQGVLQYGMLIFRFISKIRVFRPFSLLGWYQLPWRIQQTLVNGYWSGNGFSSHSSLSSQFWTIPTSVRCCWCVKLLVMCVPGWPKPIHKNCVKRYFPQWTLVSTYPGLCFPVWFVFKPLVIYKWSPFCWNHHWSSLLAIWHYNLHMVHFLIVFFMI